jgi:YopX protein.
MRVIKFRAWDRKAKAMFPVHNMEFDKIKNELQYIHGVDIHDKDSDSSGDVSYGGSINKLTGNPLEKRFELMQFTGLQDTAKRELYDGDLCLGNEGQIYQIGWMDNCAKWGVKVLKTKSVLTRGLIFPLHQYINEVTGMAVFEIIGNIHEHPQLLTGTRP